MKSKPSGRKSLACLAILLAAAVPLFFSSCGGGTLVPASSAQTSATPSITSIVPDTGPLSGGQTVVINGTNLATSTQSSPPSVSFGGALATHVTVVSSSQLKAVIPAHGAGSVSVEVTTSDGKSSTTGNAFTYVASAPSVSSVAPASGSAAGGTAVTITGTNFVSGATVSFGGVSASGVSVVSSTEMKATTPAHAAGAVSVAVTNPDGSSAGLPNSFTFASASLAVSSISPASGPAEGGTAVTITGSGFQSGTSVTIGGLAAASVTVTNSTTIQAVTPTHSFGTVGVTVTNSGGQSVTLASGYIYHAVSLAWSAPTSTPATITGYNVYRAMALTGPFTILNGTSPLTNTSFSDATVQSSTTYYYEVKSVDANGTESPPDGPVATTIGP